MWIVALALRRPYTFVVMALVLLILTPIVILRTPVDIFPDINIPVISIIWNYNGLPAQEMGQRIASVNERVLTTTVSDIEHIESTSLAGVAVVKVFFQPTANIQTAIAQTVELVKRRHGIGASKLANAVLRRIDRERDSLDIAVPADLTDALALEYSHPRWIVARWLARWGEADTRALLAANNGEAPLVARPYHVVREQLEAMLESAGVETSDAPLVSDSIVLAGGVTSLTELGAFKQGLFHLQDPASTLVTRYACVASGSTVADLCAAPGGKALELARVAGTVFAGDLSRGRMQRVRENVARVDAPNIIPFVADATAPALRDMDAVLVDVPCTGTGTFRRHPDARWRLKASDLAVLPAMQRAILRGAATAVRPGGLLIFSTCSLELEENDEQVQRFLAEHPDWTLEPPPVGVVPATVLDNGFLRVLPQHHATDGAFAARFRRPRLGAAA